MAEGGLSVYFFIHIFVKLISGDQKIDEILKMLL
jgi:hypothetical protein